jgi:hypothetical protein
MTTKQPPRLFVGGLTGRIYVTTSYRMVDDGRWVNMVSNTKYDVTEDFERIEAEREQECHAMSEDE